MTALILHRITLQRPLVLLGLHTCCMSLGCSLLWLMQCSLAPSSIHLRFLPGPWVLTVVRVCC